MKMFYLPVYPNIHSKTAANDIRIYILIDIFGMKTKNQTEQNRTNMYISFSAFPVDVSAQCNHCGRKYKQARYLARHKCIKTPEFLCHNCGNAFKLEQTLLKHHATCPAIVKKSEEEQDRDEDEVEEVSFKPGIMVHINPFSLIQTT